MARNGVVHIHQAFQPGLSPNDMLILVSLCTVCVCVRVLVVMRQAAVWYMRHYFCIVAWPQFTPGTFPKQPKSSGCFSSVLFKELNFSGNTNIKNSLCVCVLVQPCTFLLPSSVQRACHSCRHTVNPWSPVLTYQYKQENQPVSFCIILRQTNKQKQTNKPNITKHNLLGGGNKGPTFGSAST